ncbi:MAG TPA: alpha,alpha-trehalase TreF [Steroidobacteraceae bacterium]|jgi:alpha,alpha-trehalase
MARFCAAHLLVAAATFLLSALAQSRQPEAGYPDPPQVLFGDLFVAVQSAAIYSDSKAFPDAVPRAPPRDILDAYHAERPRTPPDLKRFVERNFTLPSEALTEPALAHTVSITAHIDQLWNVLTRRTVAVPRFASLLALPRPYVVPGGRFREIYYWDSYFTMLGLQESGRHELLEDMVRDFAYLIDTYGHVPNGTRTYYLSRSQPPFFFAMVGLLSDPDDPGAAYARFLPQLRKEYAFWMEGEGSLEPGAAHRRLVSLPDGSLLNRYWDDRDTPRDESYPNDVEVAKASHRNAAQVFRDIRAAAESGWDFSSRWLEDGRNLASLDTTQIIPVDLNSLLYGLENAIALGCKHRADESCARELAARAARRRAAMDRYLWDETTRSYLDYRWTRAQRIARVSAATAYPLFVHAASQHEADSVADTISHTLLKEGGLVTTTLDTGQQWDAPNGWAPLQWMAVAGLRQYGKKRLAESIACRWMVNVSRVYRDSGKLVEKYDVIRTGRQGGGGEYPLQDGFGWTNGVMRRLMALYPADARLTPQQQCPTP